MKSERWLIVAWLLICCREGVSKVVHGVTSSSAAYRDKGAIITQFCYHGSTGKFWYKINDTSSGAFYFFLDDQWAQMVVDEDCNSRLAKARFKVSLDQLQGQQSITGRSFPQYWYIMYAEPSSCDPTLPSHDTYVYYELHLYNSDYHGNPTNHLGADQKGLDTCYYLFFLLYLIVIVLWGQRVWLIIIKGGPMHSVLKTLSVSVLLECAVSLLMAVYYWSYSSSGMGIRLAEMLAQVLDMVSQLHMCWMILVLSYGWPLSSTRATQWSHPLIVAISTIAIAQLVVLLWGQSTYDEPGKDGWWLLGLMRILLTVLFHYNVRNSSASERSALRLDFIHKFSLACYLWLLAYPTNLLVAMVLPYYWRPALMTVGVSVIQMVSMTMLGRLFLSRSLYWEVSSLSATTLPLHGDRSFASMKFRNYRSFQ